ncbi:MAG: hypothetical protein WCD62_07345, partial [Pseudolabrys sp.]
PNLVTTPATGIVSEAPKPIEIPEHLQKQASFHQQVAKRFRLVPNFFVSTPDAPEIMEKLWGFAAAAYISTTRSQHFSKNGFLSSSRVSVRFATALCVIADFLLAMGPQQATPRLRRKPLSR